MSVTLIRVMSYLNEVHEVTANTEFLCPLSMCVSSRTYEHYVETLYSEI
jgi:hypothetical protein